MYYTIVLCKFVQFLWYVVDLYVSVLFIICVLFFRNLDFCAKHTIFDFFVAYVIFDFMLLMIRFSFEFNTIFNVSFVCRVVVFG